MRSPYTVPPKPTSRFADRFGEKPPKIQRDWVCSQPTCGQMPACCLYLIVAPTLYTFAVSGVHRMQTDPHHNLDPGIMLCACRYSRVRRTRMSLTMIRHLRQKKRDACDANDDHHRRRHRPPSRLQKTVSSHLQKNPTMVVVGRRENLRKTTGPPARKCRELLLLEAC